MKTSELTGAALDWAVAKCEGLEHIDYIWEPTSDWLQAGPIIEREKIGVWWDGMWHAKYDGCQPDQVQDADTPLIAAMRCYVTSKLGYEIEIPKALT